MSLNAGYIKWRAERVLNNIQRAGSVFMFVASFKILDISMWWFALMPLVFVAMWKADKWWIYPGEAAASFRENPEWQKLMEGK